MPDVSRSPQRTDRLAEVAAELGSEIIVNVQGDEPLIEPSMIDEAVEPLLEDPMVVMSTLRRRIEDPAELQNPNVTKVVVDRDGARSISRAPRFRSRVTAVRPPGRGATSACMCIAATACCSWPRCPRPSWNDRKPLNSCGRSSTAFASSQWKRTTIQSASTRRKTWTASGA